MEQNYRNHVRYYAPHHFIFYPLGFILLILVIRAAIVDRVNHFEWVAIAAAVLGLLVLSFMMRQHYALMCQNRIVRLELRFRYFVLSGKRLEPIEEQLSFSQLAALRFAGDEEFLPLLDRTLAEKLSPDAIKQSIRHWQPDTMRV